MVLGSHTGPTQGEQRSTGEETGGSRVIKKLKAGSRETWILTLALPLHVTGP